MTQTPLALELDSITDLTETRRELYGLDEKSGKYRLAIDADPRKLLGALREERDGRAAAEREAATVKAATAAEVESAQRERDAARAEAEATRGLLLESRVREQSTLAGLHPSAVNDALRASREVFKVDAAGAVVARDGSKIDLIGWLETTKKDSPHWWPFSGSGTGATYSIPSTSTRADTISRRSFDAKSPAQKAALLHSGVKVTDH